MKSKKNKVRGGLTRKEYYNLGKKITLGLVAATLLMDGAIVAEAKTINGSVDGPQYGAEYHTWWDQDVYGGSLVVRPDGAVIPTYDIHGAVTNDGDAYGGYTENGNTYGPNWNDPSEWVDINNHYSNEIIVDGAIAGNAYGGRTDDGNANYNDNEIHENGSVNGNSYGGYSLNGAASYNNNAIHETGTVKGVVYGGYSNYGDAVINTVEVYGYTYQDLYGGYAHNGNARENVVTWGGQQNSDSNIYGGYSEGDDHNANKNHVIIEKNTFAGNVYGGSHLGNKGDVRDNDVTINGAGSVNGNVYGGVDRNNAINNVSGGNVHHNAVDILANQDETVNVTGNVFGGATFGNGYGYVEENGVNISGKVDGSVTGGWIAKDGTAKLNKVDVSGTVTKNVVGGAVGNNGTAENNTVNVSGAVGGNVTGGSTYNGNANINEINISGTVTGDVTGGVVGNDGNSEGNTVNVDANGHVVGQIVGGAVNNAGLIHGNGVNIDGVVDGAVIGGYADSNGSVVSNFVNVLGTVENGNVVGGITHGTGLADFNYVYISGGTVANAIGAISDNKDVAGVKVVGIGDVTNNNVFVNGGEVTEKAVGGISNSDDIDTQLQLNAVIVNDGTINEAVGATTTGAVSAKYNKVDINGGNVASVIGANATATSSGDLTYNHVTINQYDVAAGDPATVIDNATGAMITGTGSAENNWIELKDGTVTNVAGAEVTGTGDVESNYVVVNGGEVKKQAIGGISHSDNVINTRLVSNDVTVNDGVVKAAIGAKTAGAVTAEKNNAYIKGGTVDKAYGAISTSNGNLTNNAVTISQETNIATKVRNATGGWSFSDTITTIDKNSVTIDGGLVTGQLAGGKYLGEGKTTVRNNTVTVNGGEFNQNDPDGRYRGINAAGAISLGSGLVSENKVIIEDNPAAAANVDISTIAGAISTNGKLLQNSADVKKGTVDKAYGAIADGATSAEENYVNVTGDGTNVSNAVGALGQKVDGSNFINNKVTIGEDIVTSPQVQTSPTVGDAAGAITSSYGYDGDGVNHRYNGIHGNRVIINSGEVTGAASGAISLYEDDEAQNIHRDVRVHNNYVDVKNGTVKEANGAVITGSARAEQNSVTVENGTVTHANGARIDGTGNAKGNKVNVEGGSVDHAIGAYGSTENAGELTGNTVIIEETTPGNTNIKKVATGAVSHGSNLVSKNKVEINGGTVTSAAGAVSYSEESAARLEANTVRITGGDTTTAQGAIVRGAATAANNKVDVVAGTVDTIIGAVDHGNGTLIGNEANVNGNDNGLPVEVHDVIGAKSDGSGTLKGNSANINADVTVDNVIGAEITGDATADGNIVNIDYGTVTSAAGALSAAEPGGTAQVRGALTNNIVNIGAVDDVNSNPTVYNAVGAASKSSENLSRNAVIMNKGAIATDPVTSEPGKLIGAWYDSTESSTVADNSVIINGGNIESSTEVVGAKSSGTGRVDRNMVIVNSFTHDPANPDEPLNQVAGAVVDGTADAEENIVVINDKDGNIGKAFGAIGRSAHKSIFNKNAVQINGGTVGEAIGADTVAGDVLNSEVTVSGGTVTESIFGGKSETGDVIGSKILLSGGKVEGTIFGGASNGGAVRDNSITLAGNADVSNAVLAGYTGNGNMSGRHSGNTLNITDNWTGGNGGRTANTIANFDNINVGNVKWGTPAITVDKLHLNNTNLHVNYLSAKGIERRSDLYNGKGATIIKANEVKGNLSPRSKIDRVDFGVSFTATDVPINLNHVSGEATFDAGQLIVNEQTQVIAESRTVSTALINQAGDLMADALRAMSKSTSIEGTLYGEKSFAAIHGNSSKYKTGSHVKVNGWSGIAGVGSTMDNGITWGVFLETGGGNYTTHNEIYGFDITGDGKANYTGGGVAFRQDLNDGLYYDAGFRVGSLKNELKDALQGPMGFYGYDVSTTYYGLHLGVGKVFQSDPDNSVEIYGRYFYTRHGGKDFDIAGDKFSFDSINSNRLKLGVMMENKLDDKLKLRYGLGWEYEFGGKAGSSTWGYDLTSPSLKGSSISYDLGLSYSTSDNSSLELNVSGHSGKRQGISGSVMFNVTF